MREREKSRGASQWDLPERYLNAGRGAHCYYQPETLRCRNALANTSCSVNCSARRISKFNFFSPASTLNMPGVDVRAAVSESQDFPAVYDAAAVG